MLVDGDTVCASDEPGSAFSDPDGRRNKVCFGCALLNRRFINPVVAW